VSPLQRNKAGQQILVSHYLPMNTSTRDDKLPVVVYCHCNSGSRRDAEEAVWHLLPCGVGVVAFDFTVRAAAGTARQTVARNHAQIPSSSSWADKHDRLNLVQFPVRITELNCSYRYMQQQTHVAEQQTSATRAAAAALW
jgi:hypothetical protein